MQARDVLDLNEPLLDSSDDRSTEPLLSPETLPAKLSNSLSPQEHVSGHSSIAIEDTQTKRASDEVDHWTASLMSAKFWCLLLVFL